MRSLAVVLIVLITPHLALAQQPQVPSGSWSGSVDAGRTCAFGAAPSEFPLGVALLAVSIVTVALRFRRRRQVR